MANVGLTSVSFRDKYPFAARYNVFPTREQYESTREGGWVICVDITQKLTGPRSKGATRAVLVCYISNKNEPESYDPVFNVDTYEGWLLAVRDYLDQQQIKDKDIVELVYNAIQDC